ncbi:hypothetical protein CVT24_008349 [Panaeolus cyanescens]|uniref:Uncharacterized protein n=1 Tax=Panaeolus cyanescens TaxID=181874 RepID=A0A409VC56_9AGAR|nr:hypothetical protein CVT24_008349 [Panaeolus cyanescens]
MVSLYKHHAPSTTSVSDDDDNDDEINQFAFQQDLIASPAQWAIKRPSIQHSSSSLPPILSVPPEILIHVFKHLHTTKDIFSAMQVSRSFCECAVELLWHKPAFPKFNTVYKMAQLLKSPNQTFTYARFVRRLNFINHGPTLTDEMFSHFAACSTVERLTLVGCKQISAHVLQTVLPSFHNLVALDLTGVVNTTTQAVIRLAAVATRLQGINLTGCEHVTDEAIIALARSCPLLRRVKLSGLTHLTDASVIALTQACPMLLEIDLHQCQLITDVSVRLIWTNLTYMREMRLSHCPLITDAAFPTAMKRDSIPDTINPFVNSSSPFKADDPLPPLVINRIFDNLRMLDLTACHQVGDDAVEGIISHAPKIRNLVLSKCVLLTDKSVESICKLGRHLHQLHLGHANKITDRSVRALARSCTRIRYIDFANCNNLTDMSVFELSALPKLRRVGLVRVNQLTDEAIYALAERHATLERIHLSYCDQITVVAIHFLLLKLHKLTHLSLTGVPAFRQPELQRFCREAPKEFTPGQRLGFCVFSGKGVSQLRAYLTELFDRINETNNTDDTEYEEDDDFDGEVYRAEDTPEPDNNEGRDMESRPNIFSTDIVMTDVSSMRQHHHHPVDGFYPPFGSADNHGIFIGPPPNMPQIQAFSSSSTARPSRVRVRTDNRSMADVLPLVESSASPPASDGVSNHSAGTNQSNGAGFFRNYHERTAMASPRGHGAMTPDLNYAEIGHGRGAQGGSASRGHYRDRTPRQPPVILSATPQQSTSTQNTPRRRSEGDTVVVGTSTFTTNNNLSSPSGQQTAQATNGPAPQQRPSVKRKIRNTLYAAEHYASTFFGRSSPDVRQDPGDSASGHAPQH